MMSAGCLTASKLRGVGVPLSRHEECHAAGAQLPQQSMHMETGDIATVVKGKISFDV